MTPGVRGSIVKVVLEESKRTLSPTACSRVLAKLSSEELQLVDRARSYTWVPLTTHLRLLTALRDELGDRAYRELAKKGSTAAFQESSFKALIDGAFRILGVTPAGLLNNSTRAWALSYRLCGSLVIREAQERSMQLFLVGFPASGREADAFAFGVAGSLEAAIELTRHRGHATYDASGSVHRGIVFDVTWEPKPESAG